jgi:hypothetical protein
MNRGADVLVVAAAAGAGVHAALAPEHLQEWAPLGASFVAVAVVLGAGVAALALRPSDVRVLRVLALTLAVVVAGYVTTRLAAVPPLDPEREPFDALGICTTAIEAAGLLVAFPRMLTRGGRR